MRPVRIGIIGLGTMGLGHVKDCIQSQTTELVAVCDVDHRRVAKVTESGAEERDRSAITGYTDPDKMMAEAGIEAVLIATPHYFHTPAAIAAFERGLHVLCEKPVGVHVNDIQIMLDAYETARQDHPDLVFAAMFQQRTLGHWQKIKQLLEDKTLGRLVRTSWIITTWFRTQRYYDMSEWRATWKGEGGGVLLNQCPHNLDLYQWFFGMPKSVHGIAAIGKYHNIEVEDEVTAVFEHENGMIGHFITSTAESPGTNRLEIVGEMGKLVYENDTLRIDRNEESMLAFANTSDEAFTTVPHEAQEIAMGTGGGNHRTITERFAKAVRGEGEVVANGAEGLGSVMLANAVLMSHFAGRKVALPLDGDAYRRLLDDLISRSTFVKPKAAGEAKIDLDKSF
jgi:predicted dehydrogenase